MFCRKFLKMYSGLIFQTLPTSIFVMIVTLDPMFHIDLAPLMNKKHPR